MVEFQTKKGEFMKKLLFFITLFSCVISNTLMGVTTPRVIAKSPLEACKGQTVGAGCRYTSAWGDAMSGTCVLSGGLVCNARKVGVMM